MFKTKVYLIAALLLTCLVVAGPAEGQQQTPPVNKTVSVKGIVMDTSTHLPIPAATVVLSRSSGPVVKVVVTAEDGQFAFNNLEADNYILTIFLIGYKKYADTLPLAGHAIRDLGSIGLERATGMLREVVVKGKKPLVQSKGDKLIYHAAADIGNKAGSAADVLRKTPMVSVGADGEVKMRGSSNIKVLLNGLPSGILAKNLKEALKMIPASTIQSIEVITSPSAKYEAEGAAGIINIITKKKMKGTNGSIDLNAGNLEQSVNGGLNMVTGKFNFNMSFNASSDRERNVSELKRTTLSKGQNTGELIQRADALQKSKSVYGSFTTEYKIDSTQKLEANISYWKGQWPEGQRLYNFYRTEQTTMEYNQQSNQGGKFGQADLSLNYQKKFKRPGQELQLITQYSRSKDESNYVTDQYDLSGQHYFREYSPNKGNNQDLSFQLDYGHPLSKSGKQLLETGVRYARSHSKSAFTVFTNQNNPGGPVLEDPSRSDRMAYFQNTLAAYLSIKLETNNNWSFRPGLRYEYTQLGGDFMGASPSFSASFANFVPSFLISKQLNDEQLLKLNYTERIRRPWIWDLNPYVNASDPRNLTSGNPRLRPEVTRMLELAHAYSSQSGLALNSSIYFNANNNSIEPLTSVDSLGISHTTAQNIAANKRVGVNLNANMQLNDNWTFNGGAEYFRVWYSSKALNVQNDAHYYAVNINSSYSLPKDYTLQASADYSNGFVTLQGRNSANYSYQCSVRKELLKKQASLTLAFNNPFQNNFLQRSVATAPTFHSNTTNRYYNRSFTLSFSWQFGKLRQTADTESRFSKEETENGKQGRKRR